MTHLLDANVLITARDQYYGFDMVPEFWTWLVYQGQAGRVKMPTETTREVKGGSADHKRKDPLYAWINDPAVSAALSLDEEVDPARVQFVLAHGYGEGLTEEQVAALRADPFLVAYGLADPAGRCVVSLEAPKPTRQPHNRKVSDACDLLGIKCINTVRFVRDLGFSTKWKGES